MLRGIQFDLDKSNIKPEYQPILDEAVSSLKSKPDVKVVINGHTDNSGTAQYNMGLSERRAKAVMDYFVSKGISASRLQAVGHGSRTHRRQSNRQRVEPSTAALSSKSYNNLNECLFESHAQCVRFKKVTSAKHSEERLWKAGIL